MIESLGGFALDAAVQAARSYIEKAQQYAIEDTNYCRNYLEAARVAIQGLEMEYDQILVKAQNCDLQEPDQVKDLVVRIENYLRVDKLRPELLRAIAGLKECRLALTKHADRFLQWPWARSNRKQAVEEFANLLEDLERYLDELDQAALRYRKAGTGVGVIPLNRILSRLRYENLYSEPRDFVQLVDEIEQDRTKDNLLKFTEKIERTIQQLLRAFR